MHERDWEIYLSCQFGVEAEKMHAGRAWSRQGGNREREAGWQGGRGKIGWKKEDREEGGK